MTSDKTTTDYWFTIEPYVYLGITHQSALLYNTLDGTTLETDSTEVIDLLREILLKDNFGVVLLTKEKYKHKEINNFIRILREKYMGDIIDISLSNGKPIQLLPYFNFPKELELYKKYNTSPFKNVLGNLSEISIHIDSTTKLIQLIPFLQSIPGNSTFNIIGSIRDIESNNELLSFLNQHSSPKNILCSYIDIVSLQSDFTNNFLYRISVHFPLNMQHWRYSMQVVLQRELQVEYVFEVLSKEDCKQAEQLIEQFQIEKYQLTPVYTGDNIQFFEENVFLTKEDILSTPMSIKDFYIRQSINIYDFGKINIMPNGDIYANRNHPPLGNINTDSIIEVLCKEMKDGKSWFRIRNQSPCNNCIYQWLCPSPSNYEIVINRPNLCLVK